MVSCRPEELTINEDSSGEGIHATIADSVFLGLNTHYFITLDTGERAEIVQVSDIDSILAPGTKITLSVNTAKINIFDIKTEKSIMQGVKTMPEEKESHE